MLNPMPSFYVGTYVLHITLVPQEVVKLYLISKQVGMITSLRIFRVQTSGTVVQMSHPSGSRENRFSTLRQLLLATTIDHQRFTPQPTYHNLIATMYSRNSFGKQNCSCINKFVILVCTMNVKSSFVDIFNVSHIVVDPPRLIRLQCYL